MTKKEHVTVFFIFLKYGFIINLTTVKAVSVLCLFMTYMLMKTTNVSPCQVACHAVIEAGRQAEQ